jgi:hypothetical protein
MPRYVAGLTIGPRWENGESYVFPSALWNSKYRVHPAGPYCVIRPTQATCHLDLDYPATTTKPAFFQCVGSFHFRG